VTPTALSTNQTLTATLKLDTYCQSLIKVLETLLKIDDTLVVWPYEAPDSPGSDLLNNPSAIGTSIHQLLKFFDSFRIHKELCMSYVNCLTGFNMSYTIFMESATVMLGDILAKMYKQMLQVLHITTLGWLFGMQEDVSIPLLEKALHTATLIVAPLHAHQVHFGLCFKPIWDGTPKKDWKKDQNWLYSNWAPHQCYCRHSLTSKAVLKKVLASLAIKAHTNPPSLNSYPSEEDCFLQIR